MVQVVLLELWQAVREGRYREEGKLERFIYMLSANTWRDELRRRKVRQTEDLDGATQYAQEDERESLAAAFVKDRRIEAIHHCLSKLDHPCDEIIRLYHLQEVPLQTVAEQMKYDYNNLRKRIFDCRKKLKKLVDEFLQKQPEPEL
jgi:RNA polymerase sigma factor (sigma-70 family)